MRSLKTWWAWLVQRSEHLSAERRIAEALYDGLALGVYEPAVARQLLDDTPLFREVATEIHANRLARLVTEACQCAACRQVVDQLRAEQKESA